MAETSSGPRPDGRRRRLRVTIAALLAAVTLSSCRFGFPQPRTLQAEKVLRLYQIFAWTAIGVAAIVYGLIIFSSIAYRQRKRREGLPPQFRYHVPIEITYTVIPIMIVAFLFAITFMVEQAISKPITGDPVRVQVDAFQWQWKFTYPDYGISVIGTPTHLPVMVVPTRQTIEVVLSAADVDHAFYVPDFLFKRDAIPGRVNTFPMNIPTPGLFRGECAEFCGLNHAEMLFYVRAVPAAQFRAWVARVRAAGGTA